MCFSLKSEIVYVILSVWPAGIPRSLGSSRSRWDMEKIATDANVAADGVSFIRRIRTIRGSLDRFDNIPVSGVIRGPSTLSDAPPRRDVSDHEIVESLVDVAPTNPSVLAVLMKAIASKNGLAATKLAFEQMAAGVDTLDAAVAGVTLVEDDPADMTVGYGGLPNEDGIVELDAAVMHGPTHQAGGVAALRGIRHATQVARLVMEQTDHTLLAGEGALAFARAQGFAEENLLTEAVRQIWLYWKQTRSQRDDWRPPPVEQLAPAVREFFKLTRHTATESRPEQAIPRSEADRPTGTVHCACINDSGEISCTTSTSGLAFKIPGRVGDSPIIGAGLYVDNEIGSCGSTGRGEANMNNLSSFAAVELMRNGASPGEAGREILQRVVRHATSPHLLNEQGQPNFGLKLYLLDKQGNHAGVSLSGPTTFAVTDESGSRLEECDYLFERSK